MDVKSENLGKKKVLPAKHLLSVFLLITEILILLRWQHCGTMCHKKSTVFWDLRLCILVEVHSYFGGTYCLRRLSRKLSQARKQAGSRVRVTVHFSAYCFIVQLTLQPLKVETVYFSEIQISFYRTTWSMLVIIVTAGRTSVSHHKRIPFKLWCIQTAEEEFKSVEKSE
jgi:hypothetical protein